MSAFRLLGKIAPGFDKTEADAPNVGERTLREETTAPGIREVFEAHYDYVWCSLRRLGVHGGDLEDITDEVFLKVNDHLPSYDPERPMRPWLFAFAYHAASDYRRLARHRIELGFSDDDRADSSVDPERALERREAAALLERALDAISLTHRAVFVMHEIDGTEMKDIAASLGIPLHTGYSRLRLARATFAAKVRELAEEDVG